ncbi:MAG: hypothetical protein QM752_01390 [Gammaproteobacteria bacterium]
MAYTSDNSSNKSALFLQNLWEERLFGTELPQLEWNRPITPAEVKFLLSQYPYIQVINSEATWEETIIPRFKRVMSGWVIHDYGEAMSTSAGQYLFGPGNPEAMPLTEEEEESSGGQGTIIKQSFNSAIALVEMAMEKGWPGIEIVSGTDFMQWAVWAAAQLQHFPIIGYEPTLREKKKYELVAKLAQEKAQSAVIQKTPGRG